MFQSNVARVLIISMVGFTCGALGFWLHGPSQRRTALAEAPDPAAASQPSLGLNALRSSRASVGMHSDSATAALSDLSTASDTNHLAETLERLFNTDPNDLVEMMEGFGSLTRMTDAEVRAAWEHLRRRVPSNNFGGGLSVLYLWSRMSQMGEQVELPNGWGVKDFEVALASEMSRHDGEHSNERIRERLESGESVSDTERRVIFGQAVRANPLEAVKLWCRVTKPQDYQRDAATMFSALTDPDSRDAIMAELRKWQTGENLSGAVTALARNWIDRNPDEVQQWLKEPAQADIKDAMMKELIDARALANPVTTWEWCQTLPDEQRRQALVKSAAQFASVGPEEAELGIRFLASLQNSDDRLQAISSFSETLSGFDINRWQQWRNTLPAKEQDAVNEAAFNVWAATDVNSAVAWLQNRPAGEAKDRMAAALVDLYAPQDLEAALKWLRSIPDSARRREAASTALLNLGTDDLDRVRAILNSVAGN